MNARVTGVRRWFFRMPLHLYHWRCGGLFGRRVLLLRHVGRRSGQPHETVLEVMQYRQAGPEAIVMCAFGRNADWLRNLEVAQQAEVTIGRQHFPVHHRLLGVEEAVHVIEDYEYRNRFIAPIVRLGLSWLAHWRYRGTDGDRRRLAEQMPLVALTAGPAIRASG